MLCKSKAEFMDIFLSRGLQTYPLFLPEPSLRKLNFIKDSLLVKLHLVELFVLKGICVTGFFSCKRMNVMFCWEQSLKINVYILSSTVNIL